MDWNLFWLFVILNIANVVIQTVRSIATIKCGKVVASLTNAVAYGLYTVVVVYTVCDLDLWLKVVVVAVANLVGVYVVKELEEKARKDKLWKVEATLRSQNIEPQYDDCIIELKESNIPFNYIDAHKYIIVNCYCATQKESTRVKDILDKYDAKYFVSESKTL
jgi:hypothetical protein